MKLNRKQGFTLVEVLIVLSLTGLIMATVSMIFYSNIQNSLNLITQSEELKNEMALFWSINRKISSANEVLIEKNGLFIITSAGDYYEGMVKCAYIYRDGELFYYEFPYPYGDIRFYEEDKLVSIGAFKNFKIKAFKDNKELEEFRGIPDSVVIEIENRQYTFKPLSI